MKNSFYHLYNNMYLLGGCVQVIAAVNSPKEAEILQKLQPSLRECSLNRKNFHFIFFSPSCSSLLLLLLSLSGVSVRVIDLSGSLSVVDVCLQETGGLGVHCVVDNGGITTLTHSPTHPLTHPPTHPPTHPLTHSLTHSLTHPPTHLLTHPHPPTHSLTHTLTHSPTHPLTHSLTHLLTHSLIEIQ